MRVLIVGATGVLGRHVAPQLLERDHSVRAVARTLQQVAKLQKLGAG
ncbi:MAG: NAD(P)H-binding protein [Candidatus Binatia bacterium]